MESAEVQPWLSICVLRVQSCYGIDGSMWCAVADVV